MSEMWQLLDNPMSNSGGVIWFIIAVCFTKNETPYQNLNIYCIERINHDLSPSLMFSASAELWSLPV